MSLNTALAWGEVGLVCVLKRVAGKQVRRLPNEATAAKTGPRAAPTQQNQLEPRKNSTQILYVHIYFFLYKRGLLLNRFYSSSVTCCLQPVEAGEQKKALLHWRQQWLSRNENSMMHFSSRSLLYGWIDFISSVLEASAENSRKGHYPGLILLPTPCCKGCLPERKPEKEY